MTTTTRKPAAKKTAASTARKTTPARKTTAAKAAPAKKAATPKVPTQRTPRKSLKPAVAARAAGRVVELTGELLKETLNCYVYALPEDNGTLKNNAVYVLKSAVGDDAPASITVSLTY